MSQRSIRNVVKHSSDRDVFVTVLGMPNRTNTKIFIEIGHGSKKAWYPSYKKHLIKNTLKILYDLKNINQANEVLIAFYACSGSDTVCASNRKGKIKITPVNA